MTVRELKDPAAFTWWFALKRHSRETSETEQTNWLKFANAIKDAHGWATGNAAVATPCPPIASHRQNSQMLLNLDWQKTSEGPVRCLVARSYLDCCYLRTGVGRTGKFRFDEAFPKLLPTLWEAPKGVFDELGAITVLAAELEEEPNSPDRFRSIQAWLGEELAQITQLSVNLVTVLGFSWGFLAFAPSATRPLVILISKADRASSTTRDQVHDVLFPSILLAWQKCNRLREHYEITLHPTALNAERAVAPLLDRFPYLTLASPSLLGDELTRLAPLEAALAKQVVDLEEVRLTVDINIANIGRMLLRPGLVEQKQELDDLFATQPRLTTDQIDADLAYLRTTLSRSTRIRDDLKLLADLGTDRLERRAAHLEELLKGIGLAVITFELIQSFPELPIAARVGLIFAAGFGVALWWTFRRIFAPP